MRIRYVAMLGRVSVCFLILVIAAAEMLKEPKAKGRFEELN
jgi:hypothetical protein